MRGRTGTRSQARAAHNSRTCYVRRCQVLADAVHAEHEVRDRQPRGRVVNVLLLCIDLGRALHNPKIELRFIE